MEIYLLATPNYVISCNKTLRERPTARCFYSLEKNEDIRLKKTERKQKIIANPNANCKLLESIKKPAPR